MTTTTALTPMQSFQEKLKAKVRDDIAALLPDEAIQEMVKKVLEENFYAPTQRQGGYGQVVTEPSPFVKEVMGVAAPMIKKAVEDIVREKETEIYARIRKAVDVGLTQQAFGAIDSMVQEMVTRSLGGYGKLNELVADIVRNSKD